MRTKTEKELRATEELMEEKADQVEQILAKAESEDRDPTDKEMQDITDLNREIKGLKQRQDELKSLVDVQQQVRERGKALEDITEVSVGETREEPKSLGRQFVESKGYKDLFESGAPSGQTWSTGPIAIDEKATLTTTPGTALTPPVYQPGIVETLYERLTVADLLASGLTTGNQLRYVREGTGGTAGAGVTNAAAAVAEGAAKPESSLAFEEVTDPVKKIATWLPASDEMLEDAPQIESYINQRLSLFVRQTEEAQILVGSGAGANLTGLLNRGINTYAAGTVDDNAVALFKAANGARGSSFLDMDAIVINPANWQTTRLLTDDSGQFYGGGPFYGPYGGPQGPASSSYLTADNLWGLRVVVTSAIGAGTALVGSFRQGAQLFRRSGITVEATNSHSDYFVKNLTAIRAEERLGLAVYRPSAFVAVTGLD